MALHLVTGYAGKEHVTSADQGAFHMAMLMDGSHVLNRGKKFEASIVSNNLIKVLDGEIIFQGRYIRQGSGEYEEVTIENGTQDYKRNDLIVLRYTKDATTSVESTSLAVIKGTPSIDEATDPEYTQGNLEDGDLVADYPLYRVPLEGLNVGELVPLFDVVENYDERIKWLANAIATAKDADTLDGYHADDFAKVTDLDEIILTETKNVYVSPSGSDETGDGTQENPWGTIQKAVDECPRLDKNNQEYNVILADGTYTENVIIYSVGYIRINALNETPNVTIKGNIVIKNSRVKFDFPLIIDVYNTDNGAIYANDTSYVYIRKGITIIGNDTTVSGVYSGTDSNVLVDGDTNISNIRIGFNAGATGELLVNGTATLTNLTSGIYALGGVVRYKSITFDNVTTQIYTANGGRVYTGAQNNAGTYTGNGSSTARTIETGGIGNICFLNQPKNLSSDMFVIVTSQGAICKDGTSITAFSKNTIKFEDGILTVASTSGYFNATSTIYGYQVL